MSDSLVASGVGFGDAEAPAPANAPHARPAWRYPKYFRPPLLMVVAFLVWVWARYIQIGVRGGGILGSIRFEFLLGGALILMSLWVLIEAPLQVKRSRHVVLGISLLFAAMIVQIPFAVVPDYAKDIFVDRVVKFAFLTFFIAALIRSPRALSWFLVVFLVSIFWITAESVRGLLSGALIWENQGIMRLHGAVPIYAHPNSLGGVSMGTVPFVVFLWPVWRRWWMRLGLLAVLATSLTCVLYSGSRTSYVAMIAFLLFWFARSRKKGRWLMVIAIVVPIVIGVMPEQYKERFGTIGAEEEDASQAARKQILRDAWAVFRDNPAGVGIGCFPFARAAKFGRTQDTHNLYLEVATNLGIQGFVVFLFFVGVMMFGFFDVHRHLGRQRAALAWQSRRVVPRGLRTLATRHARDLTFLQAVANAAAGFIFIRLMLGLFGMDLYEVYWWFGAGLAIAILEMAGVTMRRTTALQQAARPYLSPSGP